MQTIKLNSGDLVKVDDEDYESLSKHNWCLQNSGYALTSIEGKSVLMHRLIMSVPKGSDTDHINCDRLDNRKSNLRICTTSQNTHRSGKKHRKGITSRFVGVSLHRRDKLWRARLNHKVLGNFKNEHLAALMHDFWTTFRYGEFANTNFTIVSYN